MRSPVTVGTADPPLSSTYSNMLAAVGRLVVPFVRVTSTWYPPAPSVPVAGGARSADGGTSTVTLVAVTFVGDTVVPPICTAATRSVLPDMNPAPLTVTGVGLGPVAA